MSKLTLRADRLWIVPHHNANGNTQSSIFNFSSFKILKERPFRSNSRLRVRSATKERETVKRNDGSTIDQLRIEEPQGSERLSSAREEVGFDWKWPPWKDLPQRYKLIGTTSLAFVICNMDKVTCRFLSTFVEYCVITPLFYCLML